MNMNTNSLTSVQMFVCLHVYTFVTLLKGVLHVENDRTTKFKVSL